MEMSKCIPLLELSIIKGGSDWNVYWEMKANQSSPIVKNLKISAFATPLLDNNKHSVKCHDSIIS